MKIQIFLGLGIILLVSWFAISPIFMSGFFPMHDDTQVARIFEMGKSLLDGQFPVRWVADLGYGYGYPIFNFYAPLAYYVGGFMVIVGINALLATKIMMVLGIVLSGVFMFLLTREFWGEKGAVVASVLYIYAPYHALNIYVRGDVAEFWAYSFIPLAFYGLWKVYIKPQWSSIAIGAIGYAGIILSHNLTAMMTTPFLIVFMIITALLLHRKNKLYCIRYILFVFILGLTISAFYWVPALSEVKYTNILSQIGGGADFKEHFVCLNQLWDSPWGFGGSAPGCIDGLSFKIGKAHLVLVALAFLLSLYIFFKNKLTRSDTYYFSDKLLIFGFCVLGFIISTLFTLGVSKFFWEAVSPMAFIQYPWRFLSLVSFFSSFASGIIIWLIEKSISQKNIATFLFFLTVVFLIVLVNLELFRPQVNIKKNSSDYTSNSVLKWTASRISDEYMPYGFVKPSSEKDIVRDKLVINPGRGKVEVLKDSSVEFLAKITLYEKENILLRTAYFPAWKAILNNESIVYTPTNRGLLVNLPGRESILRLIFVQTSIEKLSDLLSVAGLLVLLTGIIYEAKRTYARKNT